MKKVHIKNNFKSILANPFEFKRPVSLLENEMETLKTILLSSCSEAKTDKCSSSQKIKLGLETALRAINNCQASCVFLSLSIKPAYIINLITRNAIVRDATILIYAQSNLEEFTQQIFGIKATAMVLPKNLEAISTDLFYWMQEKVKSKSNINSEILSKPFYENDRSFYILNNDGGTSATESCMMTKASTTLQRSKHQKFRNSCDGKKNTSKTKNAFVEYQSLIVKKIKPNPKMRKANKHKLLKK